MKKRTSITKISCYNNGNYYVELFSDGTKIKTTLSDKFIAQFPDSIDLKITNYCDNNCEFCYEDSSVNGKHAEIDYELLNTFPSGIEIALGGGNPFSHPKLYDLLLLFKSKKIIANITINQAHLKSYKNDIEKFINEGLIYGLGVSAANIDEALINFSKAHNNVVLHFINGCVDFNDLNLICRQKLKILILGYKYKGRGERFYSSIVEERMIELKKNIAQILNNSNSIISFDNLALEQLEIQSVVNEKTWELGYMGEDGEQSMYIDLVDRKFAKNSIVVNRYDLLDDLEQMFNFLTKQEKEN